MNPISSLKKQKKGFLLTEIALSLALISFLGTICMLTFLNQRQSATELPLYTEALTAARSIIDDTSLLLQPLLVTTTLFKTTSEAIAVSACLYSIKATTSWHSPHEHQVSLFKLYTSDDLIQNMGTDCGGYTEESTLRNLSAAAAISLNITEPISSFDILNTTFYLSRSSIEHNFQIAALSADMHNLTILGSTTMPSINALDAIHSYTFVAVQGTSSQFQVLDTENPTTPHIVALRNLPGVDPSGSYPSGLSIYYFNKKIYIGTHRTAGNEFHIFDVTDPTNPRWLGSIELNHNINDIRCDGHYAYLATSGNTSNLIILDVSDPTHIHTITSLALNGPEDGQKIYLLGKTLYLGRKKGLTTAHPEFAIIDVSHISSSTPLKPQVFSLQADVTGIRAIGSSVLISTTNGIFLFGPTTHFLTQKILADQSHGIDLENNTLYSINYSSLLILK